MPDGVLINGKGPYPYNSTLVPAGIDYETINVQPGNVHTDQLYVLCVVQQKCTCSPLILDFDMGACTAFMHTNNAEHRSFAFCRHSCLVL